MDNFNSLLFFVIGLILAISVIFLLQAHFEKRKRMKIKDRFRAFTSKQHNIANDARAVPRISVPENLPIKIFIETDSSENLWGSVMDISLAGFALCPAFPLKKLPLKTVVESISIDTPNRLINIKKAEVIRIEHKLNKRLLAFKICDIDNEHFNALKNFIISLDKFTAHETQKY